MRRVPSEMNVQGGIGRPSRRPKVVASLKSRRRQMTLENLERRELMAVVPSAIVSNQNVVANAGAIGSTVNYSAPSIAVNPNNPNQLVSSYTTFDTSQPAGQQQRSALRYSANGGTTWTNLGSIGVLNDPTITTAPTPYAQAWETYVAFDRNNTFYVTSLQHNDAGTAGELRIRRFDWTNPLLGPVGGTTRSVYSWNQTVTSPVDHSRDAAINNYSLAVDSNLASFTDPVTGATQTDPNSGAVYIAATWDTPPPNPAPGNYSRYSIRLLSSADNGVTWNGGINVDSSPNSLPSLVTRPRIAVSQGNVSGTVVGGRVTVVYDDYGLGATSSPPIDVIISQSVSLNSGTNTLTKSGGPSLVATTEVRGALGGAASSTAGVAYARAQQISSKGVGPNAEIASDNTLGSFSTNQGRLYVAYVSYFSQQTTGIANPVENTDIAIAVSDDGGATWTGLTDKVNDDEGTSDGKTGSATLGDAQNGRSTQVYGRTQFMPSIAVDQYTGAVVLSFYDARDDAANSRVATYVGVSIDGGSSFNQQTFVNQALEPTDAITGQSVTLGPIPDNQSGSSIQSATYNFGDHQGLAVANGKIYPIWTGNANGGHTGENRLSIWTAQAGYSRGPRVIANDQGLVQKTSFTHPVSGNVITWNDTFTADGRPIIDAISVTFDRSVSIASFTTGQVQVWYQDVLTSTPTQGKSIAATSIIALNDDLNGGATRFLIKLDKATIQQIYRSAAGGVGTYSYAIGSGITDRMRYSSLLNPGLNTNGNAMDQNGNGTTGETTDVFAAPTSTTGQAFQASYVTTTLPLIVPGPHVNTSQVPGAPVTVDNLVTDDTASQLNVTFDRDIRVNSFTYDKVLSVLGPNGQVLVPQTFAATGTNINKVIPDLPSKPLISTISIPSNNSSFPISKLTLTLNINHMQDSDLKIELIGPDGTTITLADGVGGTGQNFINTIFDNASKININAGAAPFTGTYAPGNSGTPGQGLDAFNGKQVEGVWTLKITDKNNNQKTGVLNSWTMTATPAATVKIGPQTFSSTVASAINLPIVDGPSSPALSPISIPANGFTNAAITKLTVNVNLQHVNDSDLKIELIGPDGTTITLADGVGGSGQNFFNTTFDSTAGTSINAGVAPFTGTFAPATSLAVYNGKTLQGIWTLKVTDKVGNNLTGEIGGWSLSATTAPATSTLPATDATTGSSTLNLTIPQPTPLGSLVPVLSKLDIPIGSAPGTVITKLNVNVSITHTRDSDLRLELIGPDGTTILLANAVGGNGANFTNTVFDSTSGTAIGAGAAPFTGSFAPVQSLAAFNGKQLVGLWTLRVTDLNRNAFSGSIVNWSLSATASNVDAYAGQNLTNNTPVPDALATPLVSPIVVPSYYSTLPIENLTVQLNLNHQQDSDVKVQLVGPDGTTVTLVDGSGGTGSNYTNTIFDSTATLSVLSATAPFTGTFAPLQSLGAFVGKSLSGVWKLIVTDKVGNNLTGVLKSWSLTATSPAGATSPYVKTFTVGFPEQSLRGTYTLSLDPSIRSLTGETGPSASDAGAKLDTNENAGLDLLFQRNPPNVSALPQTYQNTSAAVIPNNPANPLVSTINVPAGTPFSVGHLSVRVNIAHTRDSDLKIELIGPDGTTITLANGVGGTGANFTNTVFDDGGTQTINAGTAPFAGTYQPLQALSTFNGRSYLGTWKLRVTDQFNNAFSGSVLSWSLTATAGEVLSYNASTTPLVIAAATPVVGQPNAPSVTWAPLAIPDSFSIQSLTLNLGITYANDPDLVGDLLVFPAGVDVSSSTTTEVPVYTVHLFDGDGNVGASGTRRNFTNTVFDDAATTPIQNGGPPFNGRFNPRTPLSVLVGSNSAQYQYVLKVTNNGLSTGSLDRWGLSLSKAVPVTGLGETVSDRASLNFRLFTMDPTNPLSSNEWTPVGPAGYSSGLLAGSMTAIALDPSDPSGNTVFVGAASGGIWRTTNFLTNSSQGPTYIPQTDFGPNGSLTTGSIALFGRNNDTTQTVVIAGTGDSSMQFGSPMGGIDTSKGVGFIRSLDGGVTWTLLDSLTNVDGSGNLLPIGSRNHDFVGMTINKVLIDPKLSINGQMIVYAAISGTGKTPAGVYRSLDGGLTWQLKLAGAATDVLFDDNSGTIDAVDNPTGNYRVLFAALGNQGVYRTSNQGDRWEQMTGGVGNPTIQDDNKSPVAVTGVSTLTPGARMLIVRPALTGNVVQDVQYENWLYAASAGADGRFAGLYLTKDLGQNWVRVSIPNVDSSTDITVPTNNASLTNYDPTASNVFAMGLYNLTLAIDPNNPLVTYLGGTRLSGTKSDGLSHGSALIRVDATGVSDAHAFFAANDRNDGGTRQVYTADGVSFPLKANVNQPNIKTSLGTADLNPYINLVRDPNQPFLANTTIYVYNASSFSNSGAGATWTSIDSVLGGSGGLHQIVTVKDPLTGLSRLLIADDQGVYTGIDNKGTYLSNIGSVKLPFGSRNGNLQTTQFYYGASQPSSLSAQTAQALFYGQSQANGFPQSDPNIITPGATGYGNLQWDASMIGYGTNVATDQTGTGTVYKYKWPSEINDGAIQVVSSNTDFFKVAPGGGAEVSRTFNLIQSSGGGLTPDPQWPFRNSSGQPNVGNFAVNPLTGNQVIIGSLAGRLFGTQNQGQFWNVIANPSDLDGTYVQAPAYGAPDPNGPGVPGALDSYILAGTRGGHIYVTLNGGGTGASSNSWFDISGGLTNNDPIMAIVTNPTRGSHEAYAISTSRVYRITDTSLKDGSGRVVGSGWVDITGDLFGKTHTPFGDSKLTESVLTANTLSSLVADWRYVIPNTPPTSANPTPPTHPMLYVAGLGGVLRTSNGISGSANWEVFPDMSLNSPQDKGGIPSVQVTDLDMALGNINPTTGRPDVSTGPNVLLATTYGRGSFAIKLAPIVFPTTVHLATGSDSGRPVVNVPPGGNPSNHPGDLTDLYTNVLTPIFQGLSEQSAFGGKVAITLYDATDPLNPVVIGGYDPGSGGFNPAATYYTDTFGNFSVQVNPGVWTAVVSDGVKVIRVQATDQSGTRGNQADFTFTLDTTAPGDPNVVGETAPEAPTLSPTSDSGFFNNDNYTNVTNPTIVVLPTEGNITVYLLRKLATDPASAYQVVNTLDVAPLLNGASPVPVNIQDPGLLTDGQYTYAIQEIDPAGNLGARGADSPVITIDTAKPIAPSKPVLSAASDSGVQGDNVTNITNPIFSISSAEADPTRVYLKRNGVNVLNTGNPSNPRLGPGSIQDPGLLVDGTYGYTSYQVDLAGNTSIDSASLSVRILTAGPTPIPTVALYPDDDTGVKGDNQTKIRQPRLYGTAPIPPPEGYTIQLVQVSPVPVGNPVLATTTDPNTGNYVIQFPTPLPDGSITILIKVVDVAGNSTSSAPLTLTINTAPPAIVPTLQILPADDTGIKLDNKTTARKPHLVGNTTPGAIVDILDVNNVVVATTVALSAPDGQGNPAGYFSTQLPLELSNGTITVKARARDNVGNVNNTLGTLTMTIYTAAYDFGNEGKAQIGVYRPSTAQWFIKNGDGSQTITSYGWAGHDIPISADYTGDGKVDIAVFRPETDTWYINRGANLGQYNQQWGWVGHDTPVPTDYDGDGKADIAVYRSETADWYILGSASTVPVVNFGWPGHDKPVPGDYQNIGKSQIAVWRPETGQWFMRNAFTGTTSIIQLGQNGDIPQPGDYDGVGFTEQAVYRPSTGQYIIYNPLTATTRTVNVGAANSDVPVAADYDGDGKFDPAVYRPATATWLVRQSTNNQVVSTVHGWALNDIAIPGPLAYRVAGVNNPSTGVPAAASFSSGVASGQVAVTDSVSTPIKAVATTPTTVVGAATPYIGKKAAAQRARLIKLIDNAQEHPNVMKRLANVAKKHPLSGLDQLLEQLSTENLTHRKAKV